MNKRLAAVGIVCALIYGGMTAISLGIPEVWCRMLDQWTFHLFTDQIFEMANGFYYETDNNDMPTAAFLVLFWIAFAFVFYLTKLVERNQKEKFSLWLIVLFAVIFRVILLPSIPIHENDIYRYVWDGKSSVHGINPFKYAPADLFMYEYGITEDYFDDYNEVTITAKEWSHSDQKRLDMLIEFRELNEPFYKRIGHWQVPTIYPPVAQAVFWVSSLIRRDSIIFMKALFMLFDIGVIALIIALLKVFNRNPAFSLIYAWSPLVLKEFPNSGHYDPVAIFFTLLSIYLFMRSKELSSIVILALAAMSKFFSGALYPIMYLRLTKKYIFVFLAVIAAAYVPFFFWDQTGVKGVFQGLTTYNEQWAYNASLFAVIYIGLKTFIPALTVSYFPAKLIAGLSYLIFLCLLIRTKEKDYWQLLHRCFLAVAVLFLFSPVGDPWYYCWSIPFLCFFPYRSWILLSGLLVLSYLNFHTEYSFVYQKYLSVPLINYVIYVPFFLLLIFENIYKPKYVKGIKEINNEI